jgi:hypothetical protein
MPSDPSGDTQSPAPGSPYERVFRLPEGARPPRDIHTPAIGRDGDKVTIIVRADGWVLANPNDSPISLDGISFTVT